MPHIIGGNQGRRHLLTSTPIIIPLWLITDYVPFGMWKCYLTMILRWESNGPVWAKWNIRQRILIGREICCSKVILPFSIGLTLTKCINMGKLFGGWIPPSLRCFSRYFSTLLLRQFCRPSFSALQPSPRTPMCTVLVWIVIETRTV